MRPGKKTILVQAVMCEGVQNYSPVNPAVVFSIDSGSGKISCFTAFDPVAKKMFILHNWFHQGRIVTRKKLSLKPPKWSTFSSIQLREMDKGPWSIEISDPRGKIFKTLRFSITD
ncbi:MAG: hypothetical protein B6I22_01075 [Desulfobacteraceae bacterium 4572_123]|nr:MAG: hypothetical protein B6I22_01075 [Desulfobacteraceae bacterium 4572_123]